MGYLFAPNLIKDKKRAEDILQAFMEKSFLTEAFLIILVDETWESAIFYNQIWRKQIAQSCKIQFIFRSREMNVEQFFRQVNCYIVGNSDDEFFYLDCAMNNNLKVIGTNATAEEIFQNIIVAPEVEELKNKCYFNFIEHIVKNFPPSEYEYFLMHDGLGEVLAFFYWLKEYRKHNQKKILTLCIHPARIELMNVCPYVDATIKIDAKVYDYIQIFLSRQFKIKNAFVAHSAPNVIKKSDEIPIYFREPAGNFFHLIEGRKYYLNIPPEIKFERYSVTLPSKSIEKAKKIFEDLNLIKGKTVFFNAEGLTSGSSVHLYEFWKGLADKLFSAGYKVVINGDNLKIPNCENIFLPLLETSAFVGLCGNIVSVPTGFIETICSLNSVDKIQVQFIHGNVKNSWRHFGFISKIISFNELKYFGSDFLLKRIESYTNVVSQFFGYNVKCSSCMWGDTLEENNLLAEKIFNNIIE